MIGAGDTARAVLARRHPHVWGPAVAATARVLGDLQLAEEAVQEAYAAALRRWPADGVPAAPDAWVVAVARNRALDRVRRDRRLRERLPAVAEQARGRAAAADPAEAADGLADDQLAMLLACCHPALRMESRVALTLRLVSGLSTAEIARAFLVGEATMAQRLVRAKRRVREAGIALSVPPAHRLAERLDAALAVLALLFNEGYAATAEPRLVRADLAGEAIRLTRLVVDLVPREPEPAGLLALLLLHHARRGGRVDEAGHLVLLADQDRRRWDADGIRRGVTVLEGALARGRPGPYQLQAAIAAVHATAPSAEATDWPAIVRLYDRLLAAWPSPVVALNRAVAVAAADGPAAGLPLVEALVADRALPGYPLLPATRADLLRRLGRADEAADGYRAALALTTNPVEAAFLGRRLSEVTGQGTSMAGREPPGSHPGADPRQEL